MAGSFGVSTSPQGQSEGRDGKGQGLWGMRHMSTNGSWEPTVMFLLLLVLVEMFAYSALRYTFKNAHGG